jgi:hypothetical protein
VGRWSGTAQFYYDWSSKQKGVRVQIQIHSDGKVSGTIGNATLTGAKFMRHSPQDRPDLKDMMDYMITGSLAGSIDAAEHLTASTVFIPLDFPTNGKFDTAVNAHGAAINGQSKGILSAELTLTKER